jgi:hypothetical protein
MKVMTEQPQKQSRFVIAGSPRHCFLPSCRKLFEHACHRGEDGHYYCSQRCADEARNVDLTKVEELRPKLPSSANRPALPSPREKLRGKA